MKKTIPMIILGAMLASSAVLNSQKAEKSSDIAKFKVVKVWNEKNKLNIKVRAKIRHGWKLYAANMKKDGPVPTTFSFPDNDARVVNVSEWPEPKSEKDPSFDMIIKYYKEAAWFTVQAELLKPQKERKLDVRFMVCNIADGTCLPPDKITLVVK